jgi:hypothetical protein
MDIQKVNKIREAVSFFEDAELVTLVDEATLLIRNKTNNSVWKVNYTFENEFVLNTSEAELVTEGEKPEPELTPKTFVLNNFGKTSIDEMKTKLMDVVFKKEIIAEESLPNVNENYKLLNESEQKMVSDFFEKYSKALLSEKESVSNFISQVAYVFENDTIKKATFLNPKKILDVYSEKAKLKETIYVASQVFKKFQEEVTNLFEENEIEISLVQGILEGFDPSVDMSSTFTKNVLKIKKENNLNLNIAETVKQLKLIQKEVFAEFDTKQTSEGIKNYNEGYAFFPEFRSSSQDLNYLKFGPNHWNRSGLAGLLEDFKVVMSHFTSINEEDFKEISAMRDVIDYMYRTTNIDDEIVNSIIGQFNEKFGKPVELKKLSTVAPL